jgi:hypothetical protein
MKVRGASAALISGGWKLRTRTLLSHETAFPLWDNLIVTVLGGENRRLCDHHNATGHLRIGSYDRHRCECGRRNQDQATNSHTLIRELPIFGVTTGWSPQAKVKSGLTGNARSIGHSGMQGRKTWIP